MPASGLSVDVRPRRRPLPRPSLLRDRASQMGRRNPAGCMGPAGWRRAHRFDAGELSLAYGAAELSLPCRLARPPTPISDVDGTLRLIEEDRQGSNSRTPAETATVSPMSTSPVRTARTASVILPFPFCENRHMKSAQAQRAIDFCES